MTLFDCASRRTHPLHLWHAAEQIETWAAPSLLAKARAISAQMKNLGVGAGSRVVLMLPTSADLIACVLAVWGCCAAVCIVPHAIGGEVGRLSRRKLAAILDLLQPQLVIHDALLSASLGLAAKCCLRRDELAITADAREFPARPAHDDIAVIQLTSGSTSAPKGVPLRHDQVYANVLAINSRTSIDATDHVLSWLPLCHDMGLGALTVALGANAPLTLIPTERFVRSPVIWLQAISRQRATLSPSPAFACALLAKSARRLYADKIDLSCWRYAWIGAEPIAARHLQGFEQAMRPFGLQPKVVQPAYGLAEAVVAVSGNGAGVPYRVLCIDGRLLREHGRVRVAGADAPEAVSLVSNGHPMPGASVCIRHADGTAAAPDEQGHIWISGPFVANGYLGGVEPERFQAGWYDTGDLGFLFDNEVYISGRAKDVIIRGGVNTSPAHVEWIVEQLLDLRPGRVVAFSDRHMARTQEEVVLIVAMQPAPDERAAITQRICAAVAKEVGLTIDHVVFAAASDIPKTTSGKVQRGAVRERYACGEFNHNGQGEIVTI